MKKNLGFILLVMVLIFTLCIPAAAEAQLYYVTDQAGLLTQEEQNALESTAAAIAQDYAVGVYIITVDDFQEYAEAGDVFSAAEHLYLDYELGESKNQDGMLLLLSLNTREWALYAYGFGNTAYTDFGKDYLSEQFLDDFRDNEWYDGFADYLKYSAEMAESARDGHPIDVDNPPEPANARLYGILACTLMGFLIAFVVKGVLKGQLKSVAMGTDAKAFVTQEGLTLEEQYDTYSHTSRTRVYDPPEDDNKKGGTSKTSSGGSGSSGSF